METENGHVLVHTLYSDSDWLSSFQDIPLPRLWMRAESSSEVVGDYEKMNTVSEYLHMAEETGVQFQLLVKWRALIDLWVVSGVVGFHSRRSPRSPVEDGTKLSLFGCSRSHYHFLTVPNI